MNTHGQGVVAGPLDDGQQLDHVADALDESEITGSYGRDALAHHVFGGHVVAEGHSGQDGGLGRGVVSLDIGGRVPLGEAQALRLGNGVVVVGAFLGHPGEDEIGGAVHDAHDPLDALAGQGLS